MKAPIVASTASAGEKKLRYSAFGTTEPLPLHNTVKGYHGLDGLPPYRIKELLVDRRNLPFTNPAAFPESEFRSNLDVRQYFFWRQKSKRNIPYRLTRVDDFAKGSDEKTAVVAMLR
jgi:hypothetical protein